MTWLVRMVVYSGWFDGLLLCAWNWFGLLFAGLCLWRCCLTAALGLFRLV